eukprot:12389328-Heterocapsa_arctica.AAC.1
MPDPLDHTISKRAWEEQVRQWRACLNIIRNQELATKEGHEFIDGNIQWNSALARKKAQQQVQRQLKVQYAKPRTQTAGYTGGQPMGKPHELR